VVIVTTLVAVTTLIVMAAAMLAQNHAMAQSPSNNLTSLLSSLPSPVIYHGPALLVIQGDPNSNSTWAAVGQGQREGYKMNGMSAYTYQTGDTEIGYTVYKEVIVTMLK
jgi:hypothetical protein